VIRDSAEKKMIRYDETVCVCVTMIWQWLC